VHWPGRVASPGAVRSQFAHVIDLMPTILAATGIEAPELVDGVAQQRVDGTSLLPVLEDPAAGEVHRTQYFEMLGSRSIFHDGWKATTNHISSGVLDEEERAIGSRRFDEDRWELFNLGEDFSEAMDRSAEEPERLRQLTELWASEAERNQVLPVSDGMLDRFAGFIPSAWPAGSSQTYHPGGGPVHDESVPLLWGGFTMTAEIDAVGTATEGVVCAMGDRFGGYALYVVGGTANFTFARSADELHLSAPTPLPAGRCTLTVSYAMGAVGDAVGHAVGDGSADGVIQLLVDDEPVDSMAVTGMLPLALQHGGAGLRLGYDSGFAVSSRYTPPAPFSGVVHFVRIETPGARAARPADEIRAALHAD